MKAAAPTSPQPAEPEHKPQGVTLHYEMQAAEPPNTPVPTLNVPGATASARQLQQGTPVLKVPESPSAPDFADSIKQETKA